MTRIDESYPFIPVRIAILTMSDTRSAAEDKSGNTLAQMIEEAGHKVAARAIVKDDLHAIRETVERWIADPAVDVVITTGGTGFTGRDVTPEAVKPLFEKEIDGFSAVFHQISFQSGWHVHDPVASLCRRRARHLYLLPAGLAWRLQGRLERHLEVAARQPPPPLQSRRDHAAAHRTLSGRMRRPYAASIWQSS